MAKNRINREGETREAGVRKKAWKRPEVLVTPDPEDGWEFRWIRVSTQGNLDATNVSSKLREGWVPVKAEEYPQFVIMHNEVERFKDNVVMGGLMLCKAPALQSISPPITCLLYTSPSPRDRQKSRMPSSA